jgi:hypothetical protein
MTWASAPRPSELGFKEHDEATAIDPPPAALASIRQRLDENRRTQMKLRERLTYANVAATLALVIAVAGGTAAVEELGHHEEHQA